VAATGSSSWPSCSSRWAGRWPRCRCCRPLVLGALPIAHFGTDSQQAELLAKVIDGSLVLTAALSEGGTGLPPEVPVTTATRTADGWTIDGTKRLVPAAHLAGRILVPARTGDGTSTVFLVDPADPQITSTFNRSVNSEPLCSITFDGVAVTAADVVGEVDGGAEVVAWIADRGVAAWCAVQAGVCEAALRLTATYTSERKQFDTPIATFQAVAHRAADAYIDTEAVRLTAYQAAWRLAEGRPAAEELAIAKFWAAEGAQRVVHAAQHLHGGIGVDLGLPGPSHVPVGEARRAQPRWRNGAPAAARRTAGRRVAPRRVRSRGHHVPPGVYGAAAGDRGTTHNLTDHQNRPRLPR